MKFVLALIIFLQLSVAAAELDGPWYEDRSASDNCRKIIKQELMFRDDSRIGFILTGRGKNKSLLVTGVVIRKLREPEIDVVIRLISVVPISAIKYIYTTPTSIEIGYSGIHRTVLLEDEVKQSTADTENQVISLVSTEPNLLEIETIATNGTVVLETLELQERDRETVLVSKIIINSPVIGKLLTFNRTYRAYSTEEI